MIAQKCPLANFYLSFSPSHSWLMWKFGQEKSDCRRFGYSTAPKCKICWFNFAHWRDEKMSLPLCSLVAANTQIAWKYDLECSFYRHLLVLILSAQSALLISYSLYTEYTQAFHFCRIWSSLHLILTSFKSNEKRE